MSASPLATEEIAPYLAAHRRREEAERSRRAARKERARRLAAEAAQLLRQRYQATRVLLVGSLAGGGELFTPWSDIDLLAWGIPSDSILRAIVDLAYLDEEIPIDLICAELCPAGTLAKLEEEGEEV